MPKIPGFCFRQERHPKIKTSQSYMRPSQKNPRHAINQTWWHTPVTPAPWKLRQNYLSPAWVKENTTQPHSAPWLFQRIYWSYLHRSQTVRGSRGHISGLFSMPNEDSRDVGSFPSSERSLRCRDDSCGPLLPRGAGPRAASLAQGTNTVVRGTKARHGFIPEPAGAI